MGLVHGLAITVFTGVNAMPLLPELVPSEDGRCYKHGAPNGAVPKPALPIPPKTARNPNLTPLPFQPAALDMTRTHALAWTRFTP